MAFRRKKRRKDVGSRQSRAFRAMGAFVMLCVVFAAGFVLRGTDVFLDRIGMSALSVDVEQNPGATVSGDTYDSLAARIAETQGVLAQAPSEVLQKKAGRRLPVMRPSPAPFARIVNVSARAGSASSRRRLAGRR